MLSTIIAVMVTCAACVVAAVVVLAVCVVRHTRGVIANALAVEKLAKVMGSETMEELVRKMSETKGAVINR